MRISDSVSVRADPLGRGRKFDAHELHLLLASLLREAPRHGYQLRKQLDSLSNGFYSPSPGVLYPALARLEAQGHATIQMQGKRKRYHLTEAGHAYVAGHQAQLDHLFAVLRHAARKIVWMRQAETDEALASAETGWLPEFVAVRRELKQVMLAQSEASPAEQQRIVAILRRAIQKIQHPASIKKETS